jgi:hypothetical protein
MPRCNTTWVKKGATSVRVTVSDPPDDAVVVLNVALIPRRDDLPVVAVPSFGKDELEEGAEWETPANYRAVFTLVASTDDALDTEILLGGSVPSCPTGAHCYGACKPSGQAGVAGAWALTTWE